MDQCQLKTIRGKPAILSTHVITNFRFITLNHSVRAAGDKKWQRIQEISRKDARVLKEKAYLVDEFRTLVEKSCTFV